MIGPPLKIRKGTLILIPLVNAFGFESHDRYLPDRRDLNRSFPGFATGTLASRIANTLMQEVVLKCDYGIDLHSAASQRTNYPNIRADLSIPATRRIALAFGCSLVVNGKGPAGSLRREANNAGVPTIILEAGEPWKVEPSVLQIGVTGIRNVLKELGMLAGQKKEPAFQARIRRTQWIRSEWGGILKFHVSAGDLVENGQPLATCYSITGTELDILSSPTDAVVMSMTTMPAVKPGEPIFQLAIPARRIAHVRKTIKEANDGLHRRLVRDFATNVDVVDIDA